VTGFFRNGKRTDIHSVLIGAITRAPEKSDFDGHGEHIRPTSMLAASHAITPAAGQTFVSKERRRLFACGGIYRARSDY